MAVAIASFPTLRASRILFACYVARAPLCTSTIYKVTMDDPPQVSTKATPNGSGKSACPPEVLRAIYGTVDDKQAAYEHSLKR